MVAFATINLGMSPGRRAIPGRARIRKRAVELFRELGDAVARRALGNCGWSTLVSRIPRTQRLVPRGPCAGLGRVEARRRCHAPGSRRPLVARGKEERGGTASRRGRAIHEELGVRLDDALEEQIHERAVAAAKAALGEDAFAAAWARGQGDDAGGDRRIRRDGAVGTIALVTHFLHTMVPDHRPGEEQAFYEALGFPFAGDFDIVRDGQTEATNYFFSSATRRPCSS